MTALGYLSGTDLVTPLDRLDFPDFLGRRTPVKLDVASRHAKRHRIFLPETWAHESADQQEDPLQMASRIDLHREFIRPYPDAFPTINSGAKDLFPDNFPDWFPPMRSTAGAVNYAKISFTTLPRTSVRRKSRP